MSNASDSEQPPAMAEQTEIIPVVDLAPPVALPPPPPPEDEWGHAPEDTKRGASAFPFSLYGIIPVTLGICSLLLLMFCGYFGHQYFQSIQASETKMKNLNQWVESFQNKAESFLQMQKVLDHNKETLEGLRNQIEYVLKDLQERNVKQGDQCGPPRRHWVQYRDHCYHGSVKMVSWLACFDLCVSLNATFLQTERNTLTNITKLLAIDHTWLGLSYKKEDNEWKWEDGSSPSPGLGLPEPSLDFQGKCVYVNAHAVGTDNCTRPSSCLCEKALH